MMKERNKKLIIVVGILLLVIGVSFAYFVSSVLIGGSGAKTKLNTASINGAKITVNGTLTFDDLEIYPGHQTVSGIELIATGEGEFVPYNLVWKGTNTLTTPLKFSVYKVDSKKDINVTCNKTTKIENGEQILAEECSISNKESLGNKIYEGTINKNSEKIVLTEAEYITATSEGSKAYYYVILEYPNLNEEQNEDIGGELKGVVTVEENNTRADITIASIYKEENGKYIEASKIPEEGYRLNNENSTCSNNAKAIWNRETKSLQVSSLTISGTECNLYFDKTDKVNTILGEIEIRRKRPDFSKIAVEDEGIYAEEDGIYGGTSYYWRGAATTNYLKFGGYCWRIVRINGDGTLRLIYDGTTCHNNGEETTDSIAVSNIAYNTKYDRSEYVGWTYVEGKQRPEEGDTAIDSNAKIKTEEWYNSNLASYSDKITEGKFCNDREVGSGMWNTTATESIFYYKTYTRIITNKNPKLLCSDKDVYSLNVGLITADEVVLAGGYFSTNIAYYLYNGQDYLTISPGHWFGDNGSYSYIFRVNSLGAFANTSVSWNSTSIRPIINLRSDITISSGNGTLDNPYVVG